MKSEIDLLNQIEAYLNGELSEAEHAEFEELRRTNPSIDHQVVAHQNFIKNLKEYGDRNELMAQMQDIHSELDIEAIRDEVLPGSVKVRKMWGKHRFDLAVAASVAILAVLSTLLSTGYFKDEPDYRQIKRDLADVKTQVKLFNQPRVLPVTPPRGNVHAARFGGTGFALTTNGYIVTNFHVIDGADSVYVQNTDGDSFKAKTIYSDPTYDLAILKIVDSGFESFRSLPYTIKKSGMSLGEEVYTIGFPKDDLVFGRGFLSSKTGLQGDTLAYQVDMNVNPGNSGGPLLDSRGNVVGVIKGKQTKMDGAAFAVKSGFLLKAIESIPKDSLSDKLVLNKRNAFAGMSRVEQIKKMQDYVFIVKAY